MNGSVSRVEQFRIDALASELRDLLGDAAVADTEQALDRATRDGSHLSPVIREQLPLGRAQLVAFPVDGEQLAATVGAAVRHGVPITPRGKGTANYGQTIPMAGGLVIDTSRARTVHEIGDGYLIADAGALLSTLERVTAETGQQLLMYPSTANSSLGGFVSGGSGGTGSIRNGMLHTGFVRALDVVHAVPDARLVHVEGEDAERYVHNYGTAGVIARLEINLEPLQPWRAFFASFDTFEQLLACIRPFAELEPTPRLVSGDPAALAAALPADPAIPAGRSSLRAILDEASIAAATALVEANGGRVDDVRDGEQECMKLSMTSYNHPIEYLQKAQPDRWFHVEVIGDALVERIDEVQAIYPGGMLHIEAQRGRPIGMLAGEYTTADDIWAGFPKLEALGVGYHNPHQWYVDYLPDRTRELAAMTDPHGLLNPGKLQRPDGIATGDQRTGL